MYHKITIVGHLGRDPEMRYTPDGAPVTDFSVATTRKWNNSDGSKGEETVWTRVTVWRKAAEACATYLKKGSLVLVEGRLNPDKVTGGPRIWTGQDGMPRAQYEVTAETVKFLGGGSGGNAEPAEATATESELPF